MKATIFIIKTALILFAIWLVGISFWLGTNIPFQEQLPIYDSLRNTAAIIFAIMGAWIAILYPKAISISLEDKDSTEQVKRLFQPMLYSTVILMLVIVVSFSVPLAKQIPVLVDHKELLRGASFGLLSILTILQFWTVVLTLIPNDNVKDDLEQKSEKSNIMKRMMPKKRNSS